MMSNLEIVDQAFIDQFVATYEALFVKDPSEFKTYVDFSAAARRVYSRWKREIPLLGRTGELLIVDAVDRRDPQGQEEGLSQDRAVRFGEELPRRHQG